MSMRGMVLPGSSEDVLLPGAVPSDDPPSPVDPETPLTPDRGVRFSPTVHYDLPDPPDPTHIAPEPEQGVDLEAGTSTTAGPFHPETELVINARDTAWENGALQQEQIDKQALESTDEVYVPLAMARKRVQECAEDKEVMKVQHEQLIKELNSEWTSINTETKAYYETVITQLRVDVSKSLKLSKQKLLTSLSETQKYKKRQEAMDIEHASYQKRLGDLEKGVRSGAQKQDVLATKLRAQGEQGSRAKLQSRLKAQKSHKKLAAAETAAAETAAEAAKAKRETAVAKTRLDAAEAQLATTAEGRRSDGSDREQLVAEIARLEAELRKAKASALVKEEVAEEAAQAEEVALEEAATEELAMEAEENDAAESAAEAGAEPVQEAARPLPPAPQSTPAEPASASAETTALEAQRRKFAAQEKKIESQKQQIQSLQSSVAAALATAAATAAAPAAAATPAAPAAAAAQGRSDAAEAASEAASAKLEVAEAKLEAAEANLKAAAAEGSEDSERDRLMGEIDRLQKELKKAQTRATVKAEEATNALQAAKVEAEAAPEAARPAAPVAIYKVQVALLRARLSAQLKTTQLAQEHVQNATREVVQQQQSSATDAAAAEKAVADCKDETQMFEELQALGAAQGDVEQLKKHAEELEAQQAALMEEREKLEQALTEAKSASQEAQETAGSREDTLRTELGRLQVIVEKSTGSMDKQKAVLQAAHDRLVLDQSDAQTELALAERAVKKPPPGRQPSEKKKDKARVESLKAKVEGLGASVGSTEEGLEWMSKASVEEEDQSSASVEAAKVLESSTVDTAKISELERMNASLTQLKTELKEQVAELQDELSEAQAAASKGGGKAGAGSGGGDRAAQLKAEKAAKAAEKRVKALEAKVGKVEDLLRLEKEKSLASAGDKAGSKEADRQHAKAIKELEKKLADAAKTEERNSKVSEKAKADLATAAAALDELENEAKKLRAESSGASSELVELRAAAESSAAVQEVADAAAAQLKELQTDFHALERSYKDQVTLRKKYYNIIEDMKGKIRVYCRCRPMAKYEIENESKPSVSFPDEYTVDIEMGHNKGKRSFAYDCAFTPDSTQEETYEETSTLIQSALDGYNVCVFAYGQTGSGKTFTMIGSDEMPGLLPRAMQDIYVRKEELAGDCTVAIKTYMLELYNEQILDLLGPKKDKHGLVVKKDKNGMVYCPGSTVVECPTLESLQECWKKGESSRHVGFTKMNAGSSRSHLIISILIESTDLKTGNKSVGKLSLVDLAGSERAGKTGATADRLKEAQSINKSLSALGDVISALSAGSDFIPYRNNKLTMLMSDSLGGNAKTLMYVNISPADYNTDETLTSLAYAARVKMITNDASKNQESKEITRLKGQIAALKAGDAVDDLDDAGEI